VLRPRDPVNIVDLGLIYEIGDQAGACRHQDDADSAGLPHGAEVMTDVRDHLLTLPGISDAGVDIVYEPVWTQSA